MRNDLVTTLQLLREDAKSRDMHDLVLALGASLIRRMEMREEARDEIKIALALRRPPVFGFVDWCESNVPLTAHLDEANSSLTRNLSHAVVGLNGKCQSTHMLRGEITSFGTQAVCHGRSHFQKVAYSTQ